MIYYHVVSDNHRDIIASLNSSGTLRANSIRLSILNAFFLSLFAIGIHAAPQPQDVRTLVVEGFTTTVAVPPPPTPTPQPNGQGQSYYYR